LEKLDYTLPDNSDVYYDYRTKYHGKGVKNGAVHFDFRWQRVPQLKNTVGPTPALHKQLQYKV